MSTVSNVLITGGAGYIGSHVCKLLAANGIHPVVLDDLSTGHRNAVRWGPLMVGDVADTAFVESVIKTHDIDAAMHFAASSNIAESVINPGKFYRNNLTGMTSLLEACRRTDVNTFVLSSSCSVYGIPDKLPITETAPKAPINPYGWSKLLAEQMLIDHARAHGSRYAILRYFNASGADPDGELGEWHVPETHLIPLAIAAAAGTGQKLKIYGADYETADGTCVRDYCHVSDLAQSHLASLRHILMKGDDLILNIGSGRGYSVREVIEAVETIVNGQVDYVVAERRRGDPPTLYSDPSLARERIGFEPKFSDLHTMIKTAVQGLRIDFKAQVIN